MIRIVLVRHAEGDWRLYRQPQWMAEVRRDPSATHLARYHFDINEPALAVALDSWGVEETSASLEGARRLLDRLGAVEVVRP